MFTLRLSIFRTFSVGFKLGVEFGEVFQSRRGAIASARPPARGTAISRRDGPLLLFLQDACDRDLHCFAVSADGRDPKRSRNPSAFNKTSHPNHADAPAPGQLARRQCFELGLLAGHSKTSHGPGVSYEGPSPSPWRHESFTRCRFGPASRARASLLCGEPFRSAAKTNEVEGCIVR